MSISSLRLSGQLPAQNQHARAKTSWPTSYRRRVVGTDVAVICLSFGISYCIRFLGDHSITISETFARYTAIGVIVALIWLCSLAVFGSYAQRVLGKGGQEYSRIVNGSLAAFGIIAITLVLLRVEIARSMFLLTLPIGLALLLLFRRLWRGWLRHQRAHQHFLGRAIIVGTATEQRHIRAQIRHDRDAEYRVVGAVAVNTSFTAREVKTVASALDADTVIVSTSVGADTLALRQLAWKLEGTATELVIASALSDIAEDRLRFRSVDGLPLIVVQLPRFTGVNYVLKRALDVIGALAGLILLSPLFLLIMIGTRLSSAGPIFFQQQRVGRGGTPFAMVKFRSMVRTAEDELGELAQLNEGSGPLFKLRNDPRVTRFGGFLRRYSLDELPQLWNVLRGDMSLVGPRPPLPIEVESYESATRRRLLIQPGITGLWQIGGRSDLSWEESVRLDLYYVENWSPIKDIHIIWRTIVMLARPSGAY